MWEGRKEACRLLNCQPVWLSRVITELEVDKRGEAGYQELRLDPFTGMTFSHALSAFPSAFSNFFIRPAPGL